MDKLFEVMFVLVASTFIILFVMTSVVSPADAETIQAIIGAWGTIVEVVLLAFSYLKK